MESFPSRERRLALCVLAILILPVCESSSGCPKVKCSTSLPSQMCYSYNQRSELFEVRSCGSNEICEFNQMDMNGDYNFTNTGMYCRPQNYLLILKFPGEACVVKQECRSGICDNHICQGASVNSKCSDYADCAQGLICSNSRCQQQQGKGGPCLIDDECTNDALCFKNKCTAYFSLGNGEYPVENAYLCQTGFADQKVCKDAPANKNKPDSTCYSNEDCPLTNGDYGFCYCGMNTDGVPFCGSQPGDPEYKTYKSALIQVIDSSVSCHYNISYSRHCPAQEKNPNFSAFVTARYIYRYRPTIIGIPSCVYGVMPFALNYSYSGVNISSSGGTSSTVVIVVSVCVFSVLLLLGIVCFLCVRKYAVRETMEYRLQLRVRAGDYSFIEVFNGIPPSHPPDEPSIQHYEPQFSISDIVLSERHSSFLLISKGIPLARMVERGTENVIDQLEEGVEVAQPVEEKGDTRAGSATETGLFYRRESK